MEADTLYSIPENSVFVDNNTTYNGSPIEWYVAAKDVDGDGVVTLMMKNPVGNHYFDNKEPYNPNTDVEQYGSNNYSLSNLLQWLNSNGAANKWYSKQHQYDSAPSYANEDGFLHNFNTTILHLMQDVEKFGVNKKVHIPSIPELIGNSSISYETIDGTYIVDTSGSYPAFDKGKTDYTTLITSQYPSTIPCMFVRGGVKAGEEKYKVPTLVYSTKDSSYSWNTDGYRQKTAFANYINTSRINTYIVPVIYLDAKNIPTRYDSTVNKYYLDFSVETEYQDYGKHTKGFTVGLKINCSTNIGDTTVKVYADNDTTALATLTISGFNQFEDVNIPTSALSSLSLGVHTLTLETDTLGILGSVSITYTKTADSVPTILSNSIGNITTPVNTTYQVYDDDGDSLDVVIKLDGTQIDSIQNVTQHTDLPLTLTTAQFNALGYGNHSIVIEATDGTNTSTETLPFVKNSVPSISLSTHDLGEVLQPVTIDVTFSSDDGDNVTIKAYIDNQEIS